jgi:hypothetical protein
LSWVWQKDIPYQTVTHDLNFANMLTDDDDDDDDEKWWIR